MNGPTMKKLRKARAARKEGAMPEEKPYLDMTLEEKILHHVKHVGTTLKFPDPTTGEWTEGTVTPEHVTEQIMNLVRREIEGHNQSGQDEQEIERLAQAMYEAYTEQPLPGEPWEGAAQSWREAYIVRARWCLGMVHNHEQDLAYVLAQDWFFKNYPFTGAFDGAPQAWREVSFAKAGQAVRIFMGED